MYKENLLTFKKTKNDGFSLIELLFVLLLISILAVSVCPSMGFLIKKNEKQVIEDKIKTITQFARMKALQMGEPVYLMPVDPSLDWSKGIVLSVFDKKSQRMQSVHQWQWLYPHWLIRWSGVYSSKSIPFGNNLVHAMSNGRFILKNTQSQEEWIILLNRLGRVRSATYES